MAIDWRYWLILGVIFVIGYITTEVILRWQAKQHYIEVEIMGGKNYWLIYRKYLWVKSFVEHWDSLELASVRIQEFNR
tara:strand:+ start:2328 stop:2561 length:234 start_codon:yes stop_codon:yes gene_type:complete